MSDASDGRPADAAIGEELSNGQPLDPEGQPDERGLPHPHRGAGDDGESPTFHAFVKHILESEPVSAVVVLSGCDYLDSTFLGCLIDLHRRYGEANPPA